MVLVATEYLCTKFGKADMTGSYTGQSSAMMTCVGSWRPLSHTGLWQNVSYISIYVHLIPIAMSSGHQVLKEFIRKEPQLAQCAE